MSRWITTNLLAWEGIAYELRNEITHLSTLLSPSPFNFSKETSPLPLSFYLLPIPSLSLHWQMYYCFVKKVVNIYLNTGTIHAVFYCRLAWSTGNLLHHLTCTVDQPAGMCVSARMAVCTNSRSIVMFGHKICSDVSLIAEWIPEHVS